MEKGLLEEEGRKSGRIWYARDINDGRETTRQTQQNGRPINLCWNDKKQEGDSGKGTYAQRSTGAAWEETIPVGEACAQIREKARERSFLF